MTPARAMWLRLTLLGVVSGVMAGLVVLAFRAAIALGQFLLLPQGARGTYPGLDPWLRLLLPVAGGLLLGLIFDRLRAKHREVGIVHVLHHLHTPGKACLPAANLFTQLGGAVTAIIAGHAVDTEGSAVHIGAASASQLGRRLRVSAEEDHILAACGAAAAIAAAFNTPLAGIVFVSRCCGYATRSAAFCRSSLDRLLAGEEGLGLGLVLAMALTKLLATGTAVGLRVPGGLIGPTLFIGGAAGSALGMLFDMLGPMDTAPPAFYAMIGMAAMMGASPQGTLGRLDRSARAHRQSQCHPARPARGCRRGHHEPIGNRARVRLRDPVAQSWEWIWIVSVGHAAILLRNRRNE